MSIRFLKCVQWWAVDVDFTNPMRSGTGQLLQAAFAVSYVSSIYVHPNGRLRFQHQKDATSGREVKTRSRNDPLVIRTRLIAVSVATLISCLIVGFAVWSESGGKQVDLLEKVILIDSYG